MQFVYAHSRQTHNLTCESDIANALSFSIDEVVQSRLTRHYELQQERRDLHRLGKADLSFQTLHPAELELGSIPLLQIADRDHLLHAWDVEYPAEHGFMM